ncbi:MAG: LCP family protein [Lachnospiraceae bacterium]|nr:LCP family protein [Lachnospiraceae bacterium]
MSKKKKKINKESVPKNGQEENETQIAENSKNEENKKDEGQLEQDKTAPNDDISNTKEDVLEDGQKEKKKIPLWGKIVIGVAIAVLVIGGGAYGIFNHLYNQMNYKSLEEDDVPADQEYFDTDENTANLEELDPNSIHLDSAEAVTSSKDVINILLCGEENIGGGRGRTDSIMIATINSKDNQLKLTSIMRDSYVQIPGYTDNKINAAYHNGGMKSLIETIKQNFGIEVDGYVLVNFDSFQDIVDAVGGIDITLDEKEVRYLNNTNYISDRSNHTLVVGKNHMNGNQALGFARVRYVMRDGEYGDFARTLRHRTVMTALYQRVIDKSTLELVAMIPKIVPLLTTNIKKEDLINYISMAVKVRDANKKVYTLNVPVEGGYKITRARGMSIILPEPLSKSVNKMQKFIYGSALKTEGEKDEGANITVGQ